MRGEQVTFSLKARERWLGAGNATLLAAAAPWQPGRGDINLGSVSVVPAEVLFNSSQEQGTRLLTGLLEGRSPLVRHRAAMGGDAVEVRLLPAKFNKAYHEYLDCTAKLLPVNFDQVRKSQVGFPGGGGGAGTAVAQAKLDIILSFLKADPSVNRIQLDGHADNGGNRLTNRDLSRRRALAVMEYLKANGIPAEQITMRFHGERYPMAPNNNEANRAKNRRSNHFCLTECRKQQCLLRQQRSRRLLLRIQRPPPSACNSSVVQQLSVAWSSQAVAPL